MSQIVYFCLLIILGTYTCLLTNGTVSHSASADIIVALLPEIVNLTSQPPTIDCSVNPTATVILTCAIFPSTEPYVVTINDVAATVAGIQMFLFTINNVYI